MYISRCVECVLKMPTDRLADSVRFGLFSNSIFIISSQNFIHSKSCPTLNFNGFLMGFFQNFVTHIINCFTLFGHVERLCSLDNERVRIVATACWTMYSLVQRTILRTQAACNYYNISWNSKLPIEIVNLMQFSSVFFLVNR